MSPISGRIQYDYRDGAMKVVMAPSRNLATSILICFMCIPMAIGVLVPLGIALMSILSVLFPPPGTPRYYGPLFGAVFVLPVAGGFLFGFSYLLRLAVWQIFGKEQIYLSGNTIEHACKASGDWKVRVFDLDQVEEFRPAIATDFTKRHLLDPAKHGAIVVKHRQHVDLIGRSIDFEEAEDVVARIREAFPMLGGPDAGSRP